MTRHDPAKDERLADWLDGRLGDVERERLEAEFRVKPELSEAAERYRRSVAAIGASLRDERVPAGLADRIAQRVAAERVVRRARWKPVLGSVLAAAALVVAFFWVRGGAAPERAATDKVAASSREPASDPGPGLVTAVDRSAVDRFGDEGPQDRKTVGRRAAETAPEPEAAGAIHDLAAGARDQDEPQRQDDRATRSKAERLERVGSAKVGAPAPGEASEPAIPQIELKLNELLETPGPGGPATPAQAGLDLVVVVELPPLAVAAGETRDSGVGFAVPARERPRQRGGDAQDEAAEDEAAKEDIARDQVAQDDATKDLPTMIPVTDLHGDGAWSSQVVAFVQQSVQSDGDDYSGNVAPPSVFALPPELSEALRRLTVTEKAVPSQPETATESKDAEAPAEAAPPAGEAPPIRDGAPSGVRYDSAPSMPAGVPAAGGGGVRARVFQDANDAMFRVVGDHAQIEALVRELSRHANAVGGRVHIERGVTALDRLPVTQPSATAVASRGGVPQGARTPRRGSWSVDWHRPCPRHRNRSRRRRPPTSRADGSPSPVQSPASSGSPRASVTRA